MNSYDAMLLIWLFVDSVIWELHLGEIQNLDFRMSYTPGETIPQECSPE